MPVQYRTCKWCGETYIKKGPDFVFGLTREEEGVLVANWNGEKFSRLRRYCCEDCQQRATLFGMCLKIEDERRTTRKNLSMVR